MTTFLLWGRVVMVHLVAGLARAFFFVGSVCFGLAMWFSQRSIGLSRLARRMCEP